MCKKILPIVFPIVIAIGLFCVLSPMRSERAGEPSDGADVGQIESGKIADVGGKRPDARVPAQGGRPPSGSPERQVDAEDDEESKRTPEEKGLAADIERALDEEDFELAKKCAPLAMKCRVAEIRQSMVDTLSWFGEKAIPELTPFIADPDEDVAESAMNEWDSAVSSIDDEAEKIGMVELGMQVITDEDALESISSEYIGVDEKLAVESLLKVIESGGNAKGIAKAKETYEFITGEEFADRAAAEKWIAEEYEPPDPE